MQTDPNKQNIKWSNRPYSRDHNKSKANLLETPDKSNHGASLQHFLEDISLKIYQERIKNRALFDKIRAIDCFFGYQLRSQLKTYHSEEMLVKEYGKLLQQYEFLEKHWVKIEAVIDANTQKQNASFDFLIAPWHKVSNSSAIDSAQILQRLNKTVLFIKKQIDSSLRTNEVCKQHFSYKEFVCQSPQFLELRKDMESAEVRLRQKQTQLLNRQQSFQRDLAQYREQNQKLTQKVEELQVRIKQGGQKQKQLYMTINKMSKQLYDKQAKKQESKVQKYTWRYLSEISEEDGLPLFQILIRFKTQEPQQRKTLFINQSLEEIENYFSKNRIHKKDGQSQLNTNKNSDQNENKPQNSCLLQTPQTNKFLDQTLHASSQQPNDLDCSSTRKRKISMKRQMYSGSKLLPKRTSEDYEQGTKQLKFIRKR